MRKIFLTGLLFCFMINAFCDHQDLTDAANSKRYAEANAALTDSVDVVFIGNSITEGWVGSNPQFFKSNHYLGRGISGQTSPQLLLRFRQDVVNLHPKAVVINIGTNDIAENTGVFSYEYTMDCIISMAEIAQANGIKVVLSAILPTSGFSWNKNVVDATEKVDELNKRIKKYAEEKGFAFIDYNTPMRDENGALKQGLGRDTVHPSPEGYRLMESIAKPVIDSVLLR